MRGELLKILQEPVADYGPWPEKKVLIYGAGACGREAARILSGKGYGVAGFLDGKAPSMPEVDSLPCWTMDDPAVARLAGEGTPVLLAVFNYTADTGAIARDLARNGFRHILFYYEFLEMFGPFESNKYWFAPRKMFSAHSDDLMEVFDLWEDDRSRQLFLEALNLRCRHDGSALGNPDRVRQYFPDDIPPLPPALRLVDGGAYTGDTLRALAGAGFGLEAVAAFEPDPANFRELQKTVQDLGILSNFLFPCGLGGGSGHSSFQSGLGAASGLAENGPSVKIVSLDQAVPDFRPTLIKLDIEGAEPAALQGSRELIKKVRPRLAVCLYHAPGHLWELPKLLKELTSNYRYYLRYHGFNGFDLVAYAVPTSDF